MLVSENKKIIIDKLITYLETYPEIRFCQALYNLGIIENVEVNDVLHSKDHFYDGDNKVINRIKKVEKNK